MIFNLKKKLCFVLKIFIFLFFFFFGESTYFKICDIIIDITAN